ncbi:hypothetical protein FRC08_016268, partial [Ceratobasidium sp. 394]
SATFQANADTETSEGEVEGILQAREDIGSSDGRLSEDDDLEEGEILSSESGHSVDSSEL